MHTERIHNGRLISTFAHLPSMSNSKFLYTFLQSLTFEVLIRIVADAILVNFTYMLALAVRLLWKIVYVPDISPQAQISEALEIYVSTVWLLTLIALAIYSISGFYSRGRFYRGRFKALAIFQAVSLAYLFFGFLLYMNVGHGWLVEPPRVSLLLGWFLTLIATGGARLWSRAWRLVLMREATLRRELKPEEPIRSVLVIGGAGYIGSVLCRELLRRGYSVRVLDALLYGRESVEEFMSDPHFELMEGDSREVSAVFRAMLDMDAAVHLGEIVGDPACALDEKLTLEINLAATRMLAEAAQGYGIKRFVYVSSCSVYGVGSHLLDERSELKPVSLYARAKIACERALLALNGADFHPVILRLGTVYGLSPRPRFDLVINLLTAKAVCDGEITIFGGSQWRPFVHIEDVAQAIIRSLEAPLSIVKGGVFNVGSNEQNYTIAEVGKAIQRAVPQARLVNSGDDVDKRDYHVSFAKIHREMGFKATRTVEDGIREIEKALREGKIGDYNESRYSNYKTLSDPSNHVSVRTYRIAELYAPKAPEIIVDPITSVI